jgi:hypothetical protein
MCCVCIRETSVWCHRNVLILHMYGYFNGISIYES